MSQAFVLAGRSREGIPFQRAKIFKSSGRATTPEKAEAEIESPRIEVDFATEDVTDSKSVELGALTAVNQFDKIDIVIADTCKNGELGNSGFSLKIFLHVLVKISPSVYSSAELAEFNPVDCWFAVEASLKRS
ncbi:hypothetical protein FRB98_005904 [Tulasnella sp. 332]|nr:hypothetical protein FRB98_005904 [Tulasnella sp. 332]